jgi:hypothetical protein
MLANTSPLEYRVRAKLSSYEGQALLSLALAGVGALCVIAAAVFIFGAFHTDSFLTIYKQGSSRFFGIVLSLAIAGFSGALGFILGLNSAGQRRNTASTRSWQGFFANALVVTLSISLLIFFYFTAQAL